MECKKLNLNQTVMIGKADLRIFGRKSETSHIDRDELCMVEEETRQQARVCESAWVMNFFPFSYLDLI